MKISDFLKLVEIQTKIASFFPFVIIICNLSLSGFSTDAHTFIFRRNASI